MSKRKIKLKRKKKFNLFVERVVIREIAQERSKILIRTGQGLGFER